MEWQPIETAPKSRFQRVLLCRAGRESFIGAGYYEADFEDEEDPKTGGWEWELNARPTHWMPLPSPPTPTAQE